MGRRKTNFGCTVDGCENKANARGLCHGHWKRWKLYGNPLKTKTAPTGEPSAFLDRAAQTDREDCIEWPYAQGTNGYGIFQVKKTTRPAHREQCLRVHGEPPTKHHEAAHGCGNRLCVNPRHLRWATKGENAADRLRHGTQARGEMQGHSKLTTIDVLTIRARRKAGDRAVDIAADYGLHRKSVTNLTTKKSWAWLD